MQGAVPAPPQSHIAMGVRDCKGWSTIDGFPFKLPKWLPKYEKATRLSNSNLT